MSNAFWAHLPGDEHEHVLQRSLRGAATVRVACRRDEHPESRVRPYAGLPQCQTCHRMNRRLGAPRPPTSALPQNARLTDYP